MRCGRPPRHGSPAQRLRLRESARRLEAQAPAGSGAVPRRRLPSRASRGPHQQTPAQSASARAGTSPARGQTRPTPPSLHLCRQRARDGPTSEAGLADLRARQGSESPMPPLAEHPPASAVTRESPRRRCPRRDAPAQPRSRAPAATGGQLVLPCRQPPCAPATVPLQQPVVTPWAPLPQWAPHPIRAQSAPVRTPTDGPAAAAQQARAVQTSSHPHLKRARQGPASVWWDAALSHGRLPVLAAEQAAPPSRPPVDHPTPAPHPPADAGPHEQSRCPHRSRTSPLAVAPE